MSQDWEFINDEILFTGDFQMRIGEENVDLLISEGLKKRYLRDCIQYIHSGKMDVTVSSFESDLSVDFDPFEDGNCDRIIAVTINGKTIYTDY